MQIDINLEMIPAVLQALGQLYVADPLRNGLITYPVTTWLIGWKVARNDYKKICARIANGEPAPGCVLGIPQPESDAIWMPLLVFFLAPAWIPLYGSIKGFWKMFRAGLGPIPKPPMNDGA